MRATMILQNDLLYISPYKIQCLPKLSRCSPNTRVPTTIQTACKTSWNKRAACVVGDQHVLNVAQSHFCHHPGRGSFQAVTGPYCWLIPCVLRRAQQKGGNRQEGGRLPRAWDGTMCWATEATSAYISVQGLGIFVNSLSEVRELCLNSPTGKTAGSYLSAYLMFSFQRYLVNFYYVWEQCKALERQQISTADLVSTFLYWGLKTIVFPSRNLNWTNADCWSPFFFPPQNKNLCPSHCFFCEKHSSSSLHEWRS